MTKLMLIQGANLVWLRKRGPGVYGRASAAELDEMLLKEAKARNVGLEIRYTNLEGEAINWIYEAASSGSVDVILMNPAGFTLAGYALRDCLKAVRVNLPYVEIHITNIDRREIKSVIAEAAEGVVAGFGLDSYFIALEGMLRILSRKQMAKV